MNILGSLLKLYKHYLVPKNLDAKEKITVSYRYASWFMTSAFYLAEHPNGSLKYKAAVVVALFVFSRIIMDYYLNGTNRETIQKTVIIETIGLSLLLVPTGGLESPFIWYALNPVLIASNYLKAIYCWLDLLFYLTASVFINFKLFNDQGLMLGALIQDKYYIILAYILVTVAMRLLGNLVKQLDKQTEALKGQKQELISMNQKLQEANLSVKRSMEYVMSLYHIMGMFSSRGDTQGVFKQMVDSAAKLTESQGSFLWLSPYKDNESKLYAGESLPIQKEALSTFFKERELTFRAKGERFTFTFEKLPFLVTRVQASSCFYGYLGIEYSSRQDEDMGFKKEKLLDFLAELIALVLERHDLEKLSSKLMIMEEQNRIANEIHDSVSQRLFSIVCGLHALNANWRMLDAAMINRQLQLIEQSTKETSKELRSSIYQLSSSKRGEKIFQENIENYLRDFARLNDVQVDFDFQGEEERIPSNLKKAIHRIVREAAGNAVRHGKCTELEVLLSIHATSLELRVKDNGIGFNPESVLSQPESRGLGLSNMQALTQSLNGIFELMSWENKGTELLFKFPLGLVSESIKIKGGAA